MVCIILQIVIIDYQQDGIRAQFVVKGRVDSIDAGKLIYIVIDNVNYLIFMLI